MKEENLNGIVTAFDPIASVVLGSVNRRKFAVGRRDITQLVAHVSAVSFHRGVAG